MDSTALETHRRNPPAIETHRRNPPATVTARVPADWVNPTLDSAKSASGKHRPPSAPLNREPRPRPKAVLPGLLVLGSTVDPCSIRFLPQNRRERSSNAFTFVKKNRHRPSTAPSSRCTTVHNAKDEVHSRRSSVSSVDSQSSYAVGKRLAYCRM